MMQPTQNNTQSSVSILETFKFISRSFYMRDKRLDKKAIGLLAIYLAIETTVYSLNLYFDHVQKGNQKDSGLALTRLFSMVFISFLKNSIYNYTCNEHFIKNVVKFFKNFYHDLGETHKDNESLSKVRNILVSLDGVIYQHKMTLKIILDSIPILLSLAVPESYFINIISSILGNEVSKQNILSNKVEDVSKLYVGLYFALLFATTSLSFKYMYNGSNISKAYKSKIDSQLDKIEKSNIEDYIGKMINASPRFSRMIISSSKDLYAFFTKGDFPMGISKSFNLDTRSFFSIINANQAAVLNFFVSGIRAIDFFTTIQNNIERLDSIKNSNRNTPLISVVQKNAEVLNKMNFSLVSLLKPSFTMSDVNKVYFLFRSSFSPKVGILLIPTMLLEIYNYYQRKNPSNYYLESPSLAIGLMLASTLFSNYYLIVIENSIQKNLLKSVSLWQKNDDFSIDIKKKDTAKKYIHNVFSASAQVSAMMTSLVIKELIVGLMFFSYSMTAQKNSENNYSFWGYNMAMMFAIYSCAMFFKNQLFENKAMYKNAVMMPEELNNENGDVNQQIQNHLQQYINGEHKLSLVTQVVDAVRDVQNLFKNSCFILCFSLLYKVNENFTEDYYAESRNNFNVSVSLIMFCLDNYYKFAEIYRLATEVDANRSVFQESEPKKPISRAEKIRTDVERKKNDQNVGKQKSNGVTSHRHQVLRNRESKIAMAK
jgi:hypothetical protein